jgi:hypothetical protein
MPTVKLGNRPKSFARVVKFKDIDGTELSIPVTYKYRTRQEFGAWIDTLPKHPESADAAGEDGKFSSEKYVELMSAWNASKIEQMLEGWGLDVDCSPENIRQLCDEMPGGAEAIIEQYRAAIIEGRLGN